MDDNENEYQEADDRSQRELDELERRISDTYAQAQRDMQKTAEEYFQGLAARDAAMQQEVAAGRVTPEQYKAWRMTQFARGDRYIAMRDKLARRATDASIIAAAYINDTTPGIYSLNRNFAGYIIEQYSGDIDFTLWDEQTVKRLIQEHPDLMPYYPEERAIARGIDQAWGRRVITDSVTQGVLLGESIPKIADRITGTICTFAYNSAVRAARTAMTGACNGGRLAGMQAARSKGIDIQKEWLSTLDGRTRHSHRQMDRQVAPLDEKFENGLMYPGDPKGRPEEVYNCRCTLISNIAGVDKSSGQRRARGADGQNRIVGNVSYSQWEQQNSPVYRPSAAQIAANTVAGVAALRSALARSMSVFDKRGQEMLYGQIEGAPEDIQALYEHYGPQFQEPTEYDICYSPRSKVGRGSAYYSPGNDKVVFRFDEIISGDSIHAPGQNYYHEFGHNIDNLLGRDKTGYKYDYWSSIWRSSDGKSFGQIINEDVKNDIKKIYGENRYGLYNAYSKGTYKLQTKHILDEYRNMNGETKEYKAMRDAYRAIGRSVKDKDQYSDEVFEAYQDFLESNKDKLLDADFSLHGKDAVQTWRQVVMREGDSRARGDLSDLASKTTIELGGMNYPLGAGHKDGYFYDDDRVGTEGFAEMTDAFVTNPQALEMLKKHMPNAVNAYLEMIKAGRGVMK